MGYPGYNVVYGMRSMPLQEIQRIIKMWLQPEPQPQEPEPFSVSAELLKVLAAQQAQHEQHLHRLENRIKQLETARCPDPWVKFAGMFKDDPLFDEFVEDMAAYRRELDAEVALHESEEPSA
jgi:DNA-binding transcriptional MerR regulator